MVQAESGPFAMQTNAQVTKGCNMTDMRGKEIAEHSQGAIWMTKEQPREKQFERKITVASGSLTSISNVYCLKLFSALFANTI